MTILLVDDDACVRTTLAIALGEHALEVDVAADGPEALHRIAAAPYDWLVTDLNMEPMDGKALALAARNLRPELRSVLISGDPDADAPPGGPFLRCFAKPVDADELVGFLLARAPEADEAAVRHDARTS